MVDEKTLEGKVIHHIEVDGYGFTLVTEDGLIFNYAASDGGYSSWEVSREGETYAT